MSCPWTEKIIDGHVLGHLDQELGKHADDCPLCQEALQEFGDFTDFIKAQSAPPDFTQSVMEKVLEFGPVPPAPAVPIKHIDPMYFGSESEKRNRGPFQFSMEIAASVLCVGIAAAIFLFSPSQEKRDEIQKRKAQSVTPSFEFLEFNAPKQLRVGDQTVCEVTLKWTGSEELKCQLAARHSSKILVKSVPRINSIQPGETIRREIPLEAIEAGRETLTLHVVSEQGPITISKSIDINSLGAEAELGSMALIQPDSSKNQGAHKARVHPMTSRLRGPRSLSLQLLPGLLAEAQLTLKHLGKRPQACFEQQIASLDARLITLETKARANASSMIEENRAALKESLREFWKFQSPSGGFASHPGLKADPWLSSLALDFLTRMERQGFLSPEKVTEVARSLLKLQGEDGSFPGRDQSRGHIAVTAVALQSLKGCSSLLSEDENKALSRAFDWLKGKKQLGSLNSYEGSLLARAWLRFNDNAAKSEGFLALLKELKERQVFTRDRRGYWSGQKTLTGTRQQVANVETTAIVAQVLLEAGEQNAAQGALQWLIGNRHPTRDFGGTRASVETLKALQLSEELGRTAIQGELIASVAGQTLATIPLGDGSAFQELSLSALPLQEQDLDALISNQGLDLHYTGTGWFGARLVVRGVAPGVTAEQLLKPVGVVDQGLQIVIEKPTELVVGEGQPWTFEVLNRNSREISAPMLELELPAGFDILEDDWDEDTSSAIVAFEQRGGRQVFYLKTLEAREQLSFVITIVPRREGRFWTGVTRAYPYYQPEEENILEPLQINVQRQSSSATLTKHSTLKNPDKVGVPGESKELTPIRELDGALVIAWDEASLGEMNLDLNQLPFGTKAIDQLVTRALFQGLPKLSTVKVLKPGLVWEFELDDVYWSDGRDITVVDFLDSWNRARRLFSDSTKLPPFLDQKQTDLLHSMSVEIVSNQSLRIRLKEPCEDFVERLNSTPFLPWSILSDPADPKRVISNGAYQLERADNEEIVLTRPGLDGQGQSKILIRLLQKRDLKFRGLEESTPKDEEILERRAADLIWGYPSRPEERAGLGLIGVYLNGEAQHSQDLHVALRIVGEKVKDKRKWSHVSARSYWGVQAREIGRYSNNFIQLGYDRESLRDAADTLGHELREQGFSVTIENSPYTGLSEIPEILLSSGYRKKDLSEDTSFRAFGRVPVHLGGTLKDIFKHALDRYGYLKFPARKARKSK